jgi:hypothetical protein
MITPFGYFGVVGRPRIASAKADAGAFLQKKMPRALFEPWTGQSSYANRYFLHARHKKNP